MFKKIGGADVFNINEKDYSEYEAGVYFIGQEVRSMMRRHLYVTRLMMKLPINPDVTELAKDFDHMQRMETVFILTNENGLSMRKLVENNKNSWNFDKLYKQIRNRLRIKESEALESKVIDFRKRWAEYKTFGDRSAAHLSKTVKAKSMLIPINLEHSVYHAMMLLDEFVEGKIVYMIETKKQKVDLRKFMKGLAANTIRQITSTPFDQRPPFVLPKRGDT